MTGATVQAVLAEAARRLAAAGLPDAARDARALAAAALGIAPDRLVLEHGAAFSDTARARLNAFLAERLRRRPVAQILGRRMFWGRWFRVTGDVLDPRPETETLVAAALAGPAPARILDLGTGSGAILLTLLAECPLATGLGTDVSAAALEVAAFNSAALGLAGRAEFQKADWWEGVSGPFDLVVSNPPYIPAADLADLAPDVRDWEPAAALSPGPTGLESYQFIAAGLDAALAEGGRALFEIGAGQGAAVAAIFRAAGFGRVCVAPDLDGRDRVVVVARS
jgi:release factor glutamine methyltransferase